MTAPRAIVDWLEVVIGIDGVPRRLITVIEVELRNHFGMLPIRATEKAEQVFNSVARLIAERAAAADEFGVVPTLMLMGVTSDTVAGFCHVLPSDSLAIAAAKRRRLNIRHLNCVKRSGPSPLVSLRNSALACW